MPEMSIDEASQVVLREVVAMRDEHKKFKGWDGLLYNGGTALLLACTAVATVLPAEKDGWIFWTSKVLTGFATFWIAFDRSKAYGARWQFHIARYHQLGVIETGLRILDARNATEKTAHFERLVEGFDALRGSESTLPGIQSDSTKPHQESKHCAPKPAPGPGS
jgi:hypothetical protein